jgi:hypothetical protein
LYRSPATNEYCQWQEFQVPSACLDLDVVNVSLVRVGVNDR